MAKQLSLNLNRGSWGGRRSNSGRRRIQSKGIAHRTREKVNSKQPLHINLKYKIQIKNKAFLKILKRAILNSRRKGLRILHFSVQSNHIHFIIEAVDNKILESGMRSLTVTLTRGLNQGQIQLQRYHLHVLKTLTETKRAIQYVIFNEQKHKKAKSAKVDDYSSLFKFKELGKLSKAMDLTIMVEKISIYLDLDQGGSFLFRRAEAQLYG